MISSLKRAQKREKRLLLALSSMLTHLCSLRYSFDSSSSSSSKGKKGEQSKSDIKLKKISKREKWLLLAISPSLRTLSSNWEPDLVLCKGIGLERRLRLLRRMDHVLSQQNGRISIPSFCYHFNHTCFLMTTKHTPGVLPSGVP